MEAAKEAVQNFLHRSGKEHTEVDESVNPVVTSETVKPHRHEETTQAVNREVHQDHYHTTVAPISHTETLPEQHTHNLLPTEKREIHHGDADQDRAKIAAQLGQFKDTSTTTETTHSAAAAPTVTGEHVHHHVHETVQPVVHKETIAPEVVHTTIPIHEKHIAPSEHHGLSTLPVKSMDEYQQTSKGLEGGPPRREEYDGHPRPYNTDLQNVPAPADLNPTHHYGTHDPVETGHPGLGGPGAARATPDLVYGSSSVAPQVAHTRLDSGVAMADRDTVRDVKPAVGNDRAGLSTAGAAGGAGVGALAGATAAYELHRERGVPTDEPRDIYDAQAARSPVDTTSISAAYQSGVSARNQENQPLGISHRDQATGSEYRVAQPAVSTLVGSVGCVAAGAAAADHARDHTQHGQGSDVNAGGTTGSIRDSSNTATSTADVGARTDTVPPGFRRTAHGYHTNASETPSYGKTAHGYETHAPGHAPSRNDVASSADADRSTRDTSAGAAAAATGAAAASSHREHSAAETQPSDRKDEQEPSNLSGGQAETKEQQKETRDDIQHGSQGEDPSLVKDEKATSKITGTGVDGSHSAVFGLTPDGHKYDDTTHGSHMTEGGGAQEVNEKVEKEEGKNQSTDTSSRAPAGAGVSEQIDDPKVAEKGHGGPAESTDDDNKPGAGAANPSMD